MNIKLKQLTIINFKGLKSFVLLTLIDIATNIWGKNASGKTSIVDSFHWLLFDKNCYGKSDFNIKNTVDKSLNKGEHVVEGVFVIDNERLTLKKIFKEKWTKRRGESELTFDGHETGYFINDVPKSQTEYKTKIALLINENVFRMVTNPLYFNSLKWEDRRKILTEIVGEVADESVASTNKEFAELLTLLSGKKIEEYKKQLTAERKKLKEQIESIPGRIDEVNRSIPPEPNYTEITASIDIANTSLSGIEEKLLDISKANEGIIKKRMELQDKIYTNKRIMNDALFNAEECVKGQKNKNESVGNKLSIDLSSLQKELDQLIVKIRSQATDIQNTEKRIEDLRLNWDVENEKNIVFEEGDMKCPTCLRKYDASAIQEKKTVLLENFNKNKISVLEGITKRGKELTVMLAQLKEFKDELVKKKEKLETTISELNNNLREDKESPKEQTTVEYILSTNKEYQTALAAVTALENEFENIKDAPNDSQELLMQKKEIAGQINALNSQLSVKDTIEKQKNRLQELLSEEKKLAQEIANKEKIEFTIQEFINAKISIVESQVNKMFKYARFKMFNQQINGGVEDTCECYYNDVPWGDLNSAHRIWTGIDIINTLSKHYDISAPLFIDNRESVTEIPETNAQVINLFVSPKDKVLRIE